MNTYNNIQDILGSQFDPVSNWAAEKFLCRKEKKTMVIVEGIADVIVYESILEISKCEIFCVPEDGGKSFVQSVMKYYDDQRKLAEEHKYSKKKLEKYKGIIAIVDEDFESIEGISTNPVGVPIFSTGDHDVETLLINSRALNKFVSFVIPSDPLSPSLAKKTHDQVKKLNQSMKDLGIRMGLIRLAYMKSGLSGKISNWDKKSFIIFDESTGVFQLQEEKMINHIIEKCNGDKIYRKQNVEKLQKGYSDIKNKTKDISRWKIIQGHDLINIIINILSINLVEYGEFRNKLLQKWGIPSHALPKANEWCCINNQAEETKFELSIIRHLVMGYEQDYFRKTELYKKLKDWEKSDGNHYQILKNWKEEEKAEEI